MSMLMTMLMVGNGQSGFCSVQTFLVTGLDSKENSPMLLPNIHATDRPELWCWAVEVWPPAIHREFLLAFPGSVTFEDGHKFFHTLFSRGEVHYLEGTMLSQTEEDKYNIL